MELPSRLIVEISNVCNYSCEICFLNSKSSFSDKQFMGIDDFSKVSNMLPYIDSLVISGFGEPLLNEEISQIVKFAKTKMHEKSSLGIQTNGYLLSEKTLLNLIGSGVDIFCISVDSLKGNTKLHSLEYAYNGIKLLSDVKKQYGNFQFGVETVVSKDNLNEIEGILSELLKFGIDFVIISHLIPYTPDMASKVVYDVNNEDSFNIYKKWSNILIEKGGSLYDWIEIPKKMADENFNFEIFKSMYSEAESMGLTLNLKKLIETDDEMIRRVDFIFNKIREVCLKEGISLKLPGVRPRSKRICDFIENRCMFLSVNGDVSPCYFLWHGFECYIGNLRKAVKKVSFGNINFENPVNIYNSAPYKRFRESVLKYEFPYCYDCNFALCDLMELEDFMYDCYSNEIPCGACLWCGELFYCLI